MDNWVDYFIINEFAMNYDAGTFSTYVYKELGGKLQLAAWDFNNGFDNYQWFHTETDRLYTVDNSWFDRLPGRTKILENMSVKDMCSCVKPHYLMNILLTK